MSTLDEQTSPAIGPFGATPAKTAEEAGAGKPWMDVALLALVFGVVFFFDLGEVSLVNPDEGRYAEVPREMVATGDYVTPRLNGVVYFEKPPLVYWAVAGALRLFGPGEFGIRLVPALFALGGVLSIYAAGRRLAGRAEGIGAAVVLGSSLLYFALGRILLLDMALTVLMSATLFFFILGVREPAGARRRWYFLGLYASAALATMTKGLIGFMLPGAVMFFWLLIFNQWRRLLPMHLVAGALLFLAIAAPWHVLVALRNDAWLNFYFVREHWDRFTTTEHGRYEPWWYFLPVVVAGLFPWTGFVAPAVRSALRGGWAARRANADAWFFVTWAVVVFLFFSKSQSKLIPYILPVFPPLALLTGGWLARVWHQREEEQRVRVPFGVFAVMAVAIGVTLLTVLFKPDLVRNASRLEALRPDGVVAACALLAGAALAPVLAARGRLRSASLALAAAVAGFYLVLGEAQDKVARPGTKAFAELVKQRAGPDDRVYHYHDFFHDFTFYAERTVGTIAAPNTELEIWIDPAAQASGRFIDEAEFRRQWNGSRRLWVVARQREIGALFRDPTFRYHLIAETRGHCLFSNQP